MNWGILFSAAAVPCFAQVRVPVRAPSLAAPMLLRLLPVNAPVLALPSMTLSIPTALPLPLIASAPRPLAPASDAPQESPEKSLAEGTARFDGAALPKAAVAAPEPVPSLSAADPGDRQLVDGVIDAASRSRTGRRVLRQIDELGRRRGRPLVVVVARLEQNNGEFVYDWDTVRLGAHFRKGDPALAAPTFIHELLHVLQKEAGLPSDSLEMELESFAATMKVSRELGLPLKVGSFERKVEKKLFESLDALVDWLEGEYSGNRSISEGIGAYIDHLDELEAKALASIVRLEKRRTKQQAIVAGMRRSGLSDSSLRAYTEENIDSIAPKIKAQETALFWIRRDRDSLSTPEGAARYRSFSRRVRAELNRYRRAYAPR